MVSMPISMVGMLFTHDSWDMSNFCRIILLVSCAGFLSWYLPVAYHNVYACDDYWFGTNVENFGFVGTQIHYYLNWEGSYTHTFLDSLPHIFVHNRMPFFFNIFSLLLLAISIYYAIRTFFCTKRIDATILSIYLCTILYTFTNGDSEIRFWVSANAYVIELASIIAMLSLYHNKTTMSIRAYLTYATILLFIIAGCKLTFILYAFIGIFLHDAILKAKPTRLVYYTIGILIIFSLINVLAPGNLIRLAEETSVSHENAFTFIDVLGIRVNKLLPFFLYSLLLTPIPLLVKFPQRITSQHIVCCISFMIFTFILDSVIMYICFHDPGPIRVYILSETFILVVSLIILFFAVGQIKSKPQYRVLLCTITSIIILIYNIPMINEISPSIEFANQSRIRNQELVKANGEVVYVNPLPDSHLLLSYFANDEEWIENVYAPYFNRSNVQLKKINND